MRQPLVSPILTKVNKHLKFLKIKGQFGRQNNFFKSARTFFGVGELYAWPFPRTILIQKKESSSRTEPYTATVIATTYTTATNIATATPTTITTNKFSQRDQGGASTRGL